MSYYWLLSPGGGPNRVLSVLFEHHLGLDHERHDTAFRRRDPGLPYHRAHPPVDGRGLANDLAADGRGGEKIGLRLDGGRPGALRKIEDRGGSAERIGKGHDGSAMEHRGHRAEILAHEQFGGNAILGRGGVPDAQQFRERQPHLREAVDSFHARAPPRRSQCRPDAGWKQTLARCQAEGPGSTEVRDAVGLHAGNRLALRTASPRTAFRVPWKHDRVVTFEDKEKRKNRVDGRRGSARVAP